ncbi:natural resistance-associated macrophage protein-domain-containing protein [Phakopsora pachyrhizi]|uniref:Natural resistance-associated macrophage protein-domain-containing protein n=1 Tax=Phakopsora pachyrhizi TaxID=170000 RepID=A0AAV0AQD5_PHAPC|nr:natural resistance-associated macrophage protein-domain-containing protein [Phakopsora pachyrhizi]CAH7669845.1 natural resistance-associated macrophage protein-domain-containing protein [Phakopsora pachyrhizi]
MALRTSNDQQDAITDSNEPRGEEEIINSNKRDSLKNRPGILGVLRRHVKYLGPGVVASAAYYDPGNWATDLEAGSRFGNSHLFVLVVAIAMAIFLQILASRLGYISRKDIAENCRESLYSRPKYPRSTRWLVFYPLWLLFEIGIIFADIGELLGSAIAYTLLIPQIPIWGAVLLTFPEVFLSLLFFREGKQSKRSLKFFEVMITIVVMAVVVSSLILFFKIKPNALHLLKGYVPSSTLVTGTGFYYAIGIIGATIGPHSLILGSTLAKIDAADDESRDQKYNEITPIQLPYPDLDSKANETENQNSSPLIDRSPLVVMDGFLTRRTVREYKSYLYHSSFDIAASLLTLPLIVNSAILAVASKVYFYDHLPALEIEREVADIASMHSLLSSMLGRGFGTLFAISLLLSALAASLTITIAGQSVSSGFLKVETSPLIRRLVTRTIGIIPSAIISAALGKEGVNKMLIASQVALSVVLPFSILPLAIFTSKRSVMSKVCADKKPRLDLRRIDNEGTQCLDGDEMASSRNLDGRGNFLKLEKSKRITEKDGSTLSFDDPRIEQNDGLVVHFFSNHISVKLIVGLLVVVVTVANAYGVSQAAKEG